MSTSPSPPLTTLFSSFSISPPTGFSASRASKLNGISPFQHQHRHNYHPSPTKPHPLLPPQSPTGPVVPEKDFKENGVRRGEDRVGEGRSESVVYLNGEGIKKFELLVVGCGGGPLETNLSSYLLKPFGRRWKEGCTSLEGGSGLGALSNLIESSPESFTDFGLEDLLLPHEEKAGGVKSIGREGGGKAAGRIWGMINAFTISHAHLDHILGLVISSGASLNPRPVYGTSRTLANFDRIFDGGIWPRLVGWEHDGVRGGRAYLFREIELEELKGLQLSPGLEFKAFPLSHGMDPSCFHKKKKGKKDGEMEVYDSTAFFYKEVDSGEEGEVLFFGDVEPDSVSKRSLNLAVWRSAAPKIVAGKLSTIFLECSYPTSQPTDKLWGHLSPPFVMEELLVLAKLVVEDRKAKGVGDVDAVVRPLSGVTIVIIHIKDDILSLPPPSPTPPPASIPPTPSGKTPPAITISSSPRTPTSSGQLSPLTLSPPVPTLPTRRASGGGAPNVGWGFSRRLSLAPSVGLGVEGRRMSLPGWGLGGGGFVGLGAGLLESMTEMSEGGGSSRAGSMRSRHSSPVVSQHGSGGGSEKSSPALVQGRDLGSGLGLETEKVESALETETEEETVQERIERELNELEEVERTGVRFLIALQGMRIAF